MTIDIDALSLATGYAFGLAPVEDEPGSTIIAATCNGEDLSAASHATVGALRAAGHDVQPLRDQNDGVCVSGHLDGASGCGTVMVLV